MNTYLISHGSEYTIAYVKAPSAGKAKSAAMECDQELEPLDFINLSANLVRGLDMSKLYTEVIRGCIVCDINENDESEFRKQGFLSGENEQIMYLCKAIK